MTIEEAINILKQYIDYDNPDVPDFYTMEEAIKAIIEALEKEPCGDCISREAVVNKLDYLCDCLCEYSKKQRSSMCGACKLGSVFDALDDLSSVTPQPNKWIPLDEKEPKDGQLILVTLVNRYKKRYVKIAEFIEENYRKHDGEIDQRYYGFHSVGNIYEWADEAVAWMPLPLPYKQEVEE